MRSRNKQERYAAVDAVKAKVTAALLPEGGATRIHRRGGRGGLPQRPGQGGALEHPRPQAPHRRAQSDDGAGPSSPRSACCRAPTARRCSPAARRRRWWWRRSAPARTSNTSTRSRAPTRSASCSTTTSPPIRSAKPGAWARPAGAKSATASSPGAPIRPMLPTAAEFPYTIRVVSEITESNGSSSMATVCGSSLALMDAGVPLKRPTAGIAMGLILEGERFAVLSDILGDEDHLGDMDFKVAGTTEGVTSLQMDIKIAGITEEIMKVALAQAKDGRLHILGEMGKALSGAALGTGRIRAAHRDAEDPHRQDPRSDRHRRQGHPRDRRKDRRQDQHRGRRHGEGRLQRRRQDQGRHRLDQVDRLRSGSRPDLRRHGGQDDGIRRLRQFLRLARRPGAHLAARQGAASPRPPTSSRKATR